MTRARKLSTLRVSIVMGDPLSSLQRNPTLFSSLPCPYINARSMGNKQEELKICVSLQGYDLTAVLEAWWDSSHDCSAIMDGCILCREDRQARQGGGFAFYVRKLLECIELHLEKNDERMKSL